MSWLYKVSDEVATRQREMARAGVSDRVHLCYRCYDCARLITKLEVLEGRDFDNGPGVPRGRVPICPCGSRTIKTTNPKVWEELLLPRCWKLIWAYYMKRVSPPPMPMSPEKQREADRRGLELSRAFDRELTRELRKDL